MSGKQWRILEQEKDGITGCGEGALQKAVRKLTKVNPQEDNESAKKLLFM